MSLQEKFDHLPAPVKHIGDGSAVVSGLMAFITALNPIMEFGILAATLVWFYFRIKDMRLSNKLKEKELEGD